MSIFGKIEIKDFKVLKKLFSTVNKVNFIRFKHFSENLDHFGNVLCEKNAFQS